MDHPLPPRSDVVLFVYRLLAGTLVCSGATYVIMRMSGLL